MTFDSSRLLGHIGPTEKFLHAKYQQYRIFGGLLYLYKQKNMLLFIPVWSTSHFFKKKFQHVLWAWAHKLKNHFSSIPRDQEGEHGEKNIFGAAAMLPTYS